MIPLCVWSGIKGLKDIRIIHSIAREEVGEDEEILFADPGSRVLEWVRGSGQAVRILGAQHDV